MIAAETRRLIETFQIYVWPEEDTLGIHIKRPEISPAEKAEIEFLLSPEQVDSYLQEPVPLMPKFLQVLAEEDQMIYGLYLLGNQDTQRAILAEARQQVALDLSDPLDFVAYHMGRVWRQGDCLCCDDPSDLAWGQEILADAPVPEALPPLPPDTRQKLAHAVLINTNPKERQAYLDLAEQYLTGSEESRAMAIFLMSHQIKVL